MYISKRSDDSLYTGITTNLNRRFNEHQQNSQNVDLQLLYTEEFPDKFQAAQREKQIKG